VVVRLVVEGTLLPNYKQKLGQVEFLGQIYKKLCKINYLISDGASGYPPTGEHCGQP
jgi:hypothetical protein